MDISAKIKTRIKNMNKLPELLSPAGSFEALEAAVRAGADAVYFGSTLFNARMNAKNFTREEIAKAVEYAHSKGTLCYVTINTVITDKQYKDALLLVEYLYKTGVDALIVQDMGLSSKIHEYFPDFPLHASTQASGHNTKAAEFLKEKGFERMVIARETKKEDIESVIKNSPIEIEMFVHGALCVSCSGQCLFSSIVGGRSGNRGECAQPCRLPYNSRYPLSLKDLSLSLHIPELIESGVASLKIEGRMKSPEYVYAVTSVFRRLLDERRSATKDEYDYLSRVFSRGGFTDGYYINKKDNSMLGTRSDDQVSERAHFVYSPKEKAPIIPKERTNSLPENFEEICRAKNPPVSFTPKRAACFFDTQSLPDKKYLDYFDIIYFPLDRYDERANGVVIPPVIYDSEYEKVKSKLLSAKKKGAIHALVGNIGHIALAKECGFIIHGNYRLNISSNECAKVFSDFEDIMLSPELLTAQIRDIKAKKTVMVYGRIPLMTLEKRVGTKILTDRRKVSFPVLEEAGRDIVFNSIPTYMADKQELLSYCKPFGEFFLFSTEGKREIENTIDSYIKGYSTKREIRRMK